MHTYSDLRFICQPFVVILSLRRHIRLIRYRFSINTRFGRRFWKRLNRAFSPVQDLKIWTFKKYILRFFNKIKFSLFIWPLCTFMLFSMTPGAVENHLSATTPGSFIRAFRTRLEVQLGQKSEIHITSAITVSAMIQALPFALHILSSTGTIRLPLNGIYFSSIEAQMG